MTNTPGAKLVGRDEEIEAIGQAIKTEDQSIQIFLISGPSGIGKTRLLQEIETRFSDAGSVLIAPRMDCYKTSAHIPFSIERHLAQEFGAFQRFTPSLRDWYRHKFSDIQPTLMDETSKAVREAFLEDYRDLARSKRIVLLIDTVEIAQRSDLWDRILDLIPYLTNTVVLLAGQELDKLHKELAKRYEAHKSIRLLLKDLDDFNKLEVSSFIQQRLEGFSIDESTIEKIRILTGGRPVLVLLAIEWLKRAIEFEILDKYTLDDLYNLPKAQAKSDNAVVNQVTLSQLQQQVEKVLVEGILELSDYVDQAILQMSWVHRRFDFDILGVIFDIQATERDQLLSQLRTLPFTRQLPDGVCVLHDNVRDLVVKHDWPIVDPGGTYRSELDKKMVEYYNRVITKLLEQIVQIRKTVAKSLEQQDQQESDTYFDQLITVETERWIYEAEGLFYALRADPEGGVARFVRSFDQATESNPDLRALLVAEIKDQPQEFYARLSQTANFSIKVRLAKDLADANKVEQAYAEYLGLREHPGATPEDRIDILIQLGNAAVRLPKPDMNAGELYFEQALQLSKMLDYPLWIARGFHALGWLRRLQGRWSEAIEEYEEGLRYVGSIGDELQQNKIEAYLQNSLGFVEHLRGNGKKAEEHCLRALEHWKKMNARRQLGSIYSTLGEVMTGQDRYDDALSYYHQALNIFQEQRAWEWQVLIYRQMAYSRWCTRDLDDAWVYIRTSQDLAEKYQVSRELPAIYYTLGLIIWDDFPDLDRASEIFKRGLEESRSHHDGQMVIANLVALVEIAYRQDDEAQAERLTSELRAEIGEGNLNYPLVEGRLERILAENAYDKGNYDRSLEHYLKAIPLIAQHGGYSIYKLSTALLFLSSRMEDLLPLQALHWSHTMKTAWESIKELSDFCEEQIAAAKSRLGQESS